MQLGAFVRLITLFFAVELSWGLLSSQTVTLTPRALTFAENSYQIAQYVADFDEDIAVLLGYNCPAWFSSPSDFRLNSTSLTRSPLSGDWDVGILNWTATCEESIYYSEANCFAACSYADSTTCGQLNPDSELYELCQGYQCPRYDAAELAFCADDNIARDFEPWINLNNEQVVEGTTFTLIEGETLYLRYDVEDPCLGVSLRITISSGSILAFASRGSWSQPGFDNKLSEDFFYMDATQASQTLVFCPTDRWNSGHLFLSILGVIDASFSFALDGEVDVPPPPPSVLVGNNCSNLGCLVDDETPFLCPPGASCTSEVLIFYELPDVGTEETCENVIINVETTFSTFQKSIIVYVIDDAGLSSSFESDRPLSTLRLCTNQTLFLFVTEIPLPFYPYPNSYQELNRMSYVVTITTEASFQETLLTDLDPYSAGLSELANAVSLSCPIFTLNELCLYCNISQMTYPQEEPMPWPPARAFANEVGDWNTQSLNKYTPYLDPAVNFQSQRVQWFTWFESATQSLTQPPVFTFLDTLGSLSELGCEWSFHPKLISATTKQLLASLPIIPPAELRPVCQYDTFKTAWSNLNHILYQILKSDDASTVSALAFAASLSLYPSQYAACIEYTQYLLLSSEPTYLDIDTDACVDNPDQWPGDPCCDEFTALFECCSARVKTVPSYNFTNDTAKVNAFCTSSAQCIESFVSDFRLQLRLQFDAVEGCSATTNSVTAEENDLLNTLQECSRLAFSSDQDKPWQCKANKDCPSGYNCSIWGSCNVDRPYMEHAYVSCLAGPASNLSSFVLEKLRATVGSSASIRTDQFVADVEQYFQEPTCVYNQSLGLPWRPYHQKRALCEDADACNAFERDRATTLSDYLVICAERSCPQSVSCLPPFTSCTRYWQRVTAITSQEDCEARVGQRCNSKDCTSVIDPSICLQSCQNSGQFCGICPSGSFSSPSCNEYAAQEDTCSSFSYCYIGAVIEGTPDQCLPACGSLVFDFDGVVAVGDTDICYVAGFFLPANSCPPDADIFPCSLLTYNEMVACLNSGSCPCRPVTSSDCSSYGTCETWFYWAMTSPFSYCETEWIDDVDYCAKGQVITPFGCTAVNHTICEGTEVPFSWSSEVCLDHPNICNQRVTTSQLQGDNCTNCGGFSMPAQRYSPLPYTSGGTPLQLIESQTEPYFSWESALDISNLATVINSFIETQVANSIKSQTLCLFSGLQSLMFGITCDCAASSSSSSLDCFATTDRLPIAVGFPCPNTEYLFPAPPSSLSFSADSVPGSNLECTAVAITVDYLGTLRAPTTQSSPALFNRQIPIYDFQVSNKDNYEVGQIIGDGIIINSLSQFVQVDPPTSKFIGYNVTICLALRREEAGRLRHKSFKVPDFGRRVKERIYPLYLRTAAFGADNDTICAVIPQLRFGDSFYPIVRQQDTTEPADGDLFATWEYGLIYTTAGLYFFCLAIALFRILQLGFTGSLLSLRLANPLCLAIFNIFRAIYFLLLGLGVWVGTEPYVTFLIVDIPYFFFFLGTTLLLWWWVALAWTTDKSRLDRNFYFLTISTSLFLALLLVVIAVLYATSNSSTPLNCGGRESSSSSQLSEQNIILIVYKSVLAFFALCLCILFFFTERKLQKIAPGSMGTRVTLITFTSVLSFFSQSVYFIFLAAFSQGTNSFTDSVWSLIPLWFIEVLPQIFMLILFQTSEAQRKPSHGRQRTYSRDGTSDPHDIALIPIPESRLVTDSPVGAAT